jgi:hypothetical protein
VLMILIFWLARTIVAAPRRAGTVCNEDMMRSRMLSLVLGGRKIYEISAVLATVGYEK